MIAPDWLSALKTAHVSFAVLSAGGFVLRYFWLWRDSPLLRARLTRVLPHINDSLLLLTAVAMLWGRAWNPFTIDWLSAKLVALLVYIGFGMVALRPACSRSLRLAAGGAAVLVLAYLFGVASARHPLGPMLWI